MIWSTNELSRIADTLERTERKAETASVVANQFATDAVKAVNALSEKLEGLKTSSSQPFDDGRLTKLEGRLRALEELLTEKTPRGNTKLSRLGKQLQAGQPIKG